MAALTEKFGKPHQLALSKIARVMDAPDVRPGDPEAFERFALQVQALVGLLKSLGPDGDAELRCFLNVFQCSDSENRILNLLQMKLRSDESDSLNQFFSKNQKNPADLVFR
ncbi:guanine nucleotide-binding subunit alpha-12 isoform X2 [Labeo rohita]|uniref:Guanine nucleotide-binding subunit alpha-12 isoform X2 n=1 Tax=Labeo rohita TaxID=84645 RepID=A0A498P4W7_LABRO|nr:guanine nucleotide-binding subunit alpha-12 isoform X2 [Labeo rohita]